MKHYEFLVEVDVADDGPGSASLRQELEDNLTTEDARNVGIRTVEVTKLIGKGIDAE